MNPAQQYEFAGHENETVAQLAWWMRRTGKLLAILGGGQLTLMLLAMATLPFVPVVPNLREERWAMLLNLLVGAAGSLVYLLVARWTAQAANNFQKIVDTRGSDVTHLLAALTALRKPFTLMYWCFVFSLLLMVAVWTIGAGTAILLGR